MPYIDPERMRAIVSGDPPRNVGELTFAFVSLIAAYLDEKYDSEDGIHYADLAEVTAALEEAKADFRQRVVEPYERSKRNNHGDVYGRGVIEYVGGDYAGFRA